VRISSLPLIFNSSTNAKSPLHGRPHESFGHDTLPFSFSVEPTVAIGLPSYFGPSLHGASTQLP
jgi:hypothetical protein